MVSIEAIGVSQEISGLNPKDMNRELTLLSGKYAGTCYAKDGYETIKGQSDEKALKRAQGTADRGHHSVFQHSMVTMEIRCPKIIAMLLNSIGVSNTSEKSARYTKMKPETEKEGILYEKWHDIIVKEIEKEYPGMFDEKEADKLAYENARYMISVFSPTSMVYSLPFRNIFYVIDWSRGMIDNLGKVKSSFNERLAAELEKLADSLLEVVGGEMNFHDNKCEYFRFMPVQAIGDWDDDNIEFYGDVYTAKFFASFAQVAQEQRHRTLRVKIIFSGEEPVEFGFYIPEILKEEALRQEWVEDISSIAGVYPQGMLVSVTEQGLFEDFVLKCKERMCGRAQLEIMRITEKLITKFVEDQDNLSTANMRRLKEITEKRKPCARCLYPDFTCSDGCKWGPKNAVSRHI